MVSFIGFFLLRSVAVSLFLVLCSLTPLLLAGAGDPANRSVQQSKPGGFGIRHRKVNFPAQMGMVTGWHLIQMQKD
jgi:hypothetical protein